MVARQFRCHKSRSMPLDSMNSKKFTSSSFPSRTFFRMACAPCLAGLLLITGCNAAPRAANHSISLGMVGPPQGSIGEALIEGASSDFNGMAEIDGEPVKLRWSPLPDLQMIYSAANMYGDVELALSAAMLSLELANPSEREAAWSMVAKAITNAPAGVTIAIAEMIPQMITSAEKTHGFDTGSSLAVGAIQARARQHLNEADQNYTNAQGTFDDDEVLISDALLDAQFGGRINSSGSSDPYLMMQYERVAASCRGDLWSEQIAQVSRAFDQSLVFGKTSVARSFQRAHNALNLYDQTGNVSTHVPAEPNADTVSMWKSASRGVSGTSGGPYVPAEPNPDTLSLWKSASRGVSGTSGGRR